MSVAGVPYTAYTAFILSLLDVLSTTSLRVVVRPRGVEPLAGMVRGTVAHWG